MIARPIFLSCYISPKFMNTEKSKLFWWLLFCFFKQEGLPVQMEVTLEDMTEEEEFDSDTVYGKEHVLNVTCSMVSVGKRNAKAMC